MLLLLNTQGIQVLCRNNSFHLKTKDHEKLISPTRLSGILITTKVTIHSNALLLAFRHDIPIYHLNHLGDVTGVFRKATFNNATLIRRNQVLFAYESFRAVEWVLGLVRNKIQGQWQNLLYFRDRKKGLTGDLASTGVLFESSLATLYSLSTQKLSACRGAILGLEGSTARAYWSVLTGTLPEAYRFEGRSKNPATDGFNAALNYLYGVLYTTVETALFTAGLDPFLGIFHTDQYQKPTLAFDLIEPFRPWADRFLVECFWRNEIKEVFFIRNAKGMSLGKEGKQYLIPLFLEYLNEKTTYLGQIAPRKTLIQRKADELALLLLNYKTDE